MSQSNSNSRKLLYYCSLFAAESFVLKAFVTLVYRVSIQTLMCHILKRNTGVIEYAIYTAIYLPGTSRFNLHSLLIPDMEVILKPACSGLKFEKSAIW